VLFISVWFMVYDAFSVYAIAIKHLAHLHYEMSACGVNGVNMNSRTIEYTSPTSRTEQLTFS
jgi:hypothetical protein